MFSIGPISVRWYGLLFASAFIFGYKVMQWVYKKENKPVSDVEQLTVYMILGTVIGARLGHCLFYNPDFYLSNPLEILKVWKGLQLVL
jgi:prolipoprotein diacylglyceryltransferase